MLCEQGLEFLFEGYFLVVGRLLADVASYGGDLGGADAEGCVTFLPFEGMFVAVCEAG